MSDYELLQAAERDGIDVVITSDTHLQEHHDLSSQKLSVIVLTHSRWKLIRMVLGDVEEAIMEARPGSYTVVEIPEQARSEHFGEL